jgi:hypothetical protein
MASPSSSNLRSSCVLVAVFVFIGFQDADVLRLDM